MGLVRLGGAYRRGCVWFVISWNQGVMGMGLESVGKTPATGTLGWGQGAWKATGEGDEGPAAGQPGCESL